MIVWSSPILRSGIIPLLRKGPSSFAFSNVFKNEGMNQIQVRTCKSRGDIFNITPSTFTWNKTKDIIKFYITLIGIPMLGVIFYANVFIGPATLKPIPEGYEPKHWEYYNHPISRFISKYLTENPQKVYEKMCFAWFYNAERKLLSDLERKVKFLISERHDFQAWYYSPIYLKYTRQRLKKVKDYEETDLLPGGFPTYY